jgi:hypothetical protein
LQNDYPSREDLDDSLIYLSVSRVCSAA